MKSVRKILLMAACFGLTQISCVGKVVAWMAKAIESTEQTAGGYNEFKLGESIKSPASNEGLVNNTRRALAQKLNANFNSDYPGYEEARAYAQGDFTLSGDTVRIKAIQEELFRRQNEGQSKPTWSSSYYQGNQPNSGSSAAPNFSLPYISDSAVRAAVQEIKQYGKDCLEGWTGINGRDSNKTGEGKRTEEELGKEKYYLETKLEEIDDGIKECSHTTPTQVKQELQDLKKRVDGILGQVNRELRDMRNPPVPFIAGRKSQNMAQLLAQPTTQSQKVGTKAR